MRLSVLLLGIVAVGCSQAEAHPTWACEVPFAENWRGHADQYDKAVGMLEVRLEWLEGRAVASCDALPASVRRLDGVDDIHLFWVHHMGATRTPYRARYLKLEGEIARVRGVLAVRAAQCR